MTSSGVNNSNKCKKLKKCVSLCAESSNLDQEYKKVQRGRSAEQLRKIKPENQVKKEISLEEDIEDDEILFPFDASKRLSQQVEALLEENTQLRRSLVEAEARLRGVVTKCPPGMGNHGRASDLAASKIVELSKRVRELTADLEVAKMRCRAAELSSFTASHEEPAPEKVTMDEKKPLENDIKELTEKLSSANLKVCEYRNQCQQLKHELKMAHKALVSEVGEGISVNSVISGGGGAGWRGRAQQIQALQQRLSELTEKTSHPEAVEKEAKKAVSAARLLEKELRSEHDKEVAGLRDQLEEKQKKLDATKARTRVLENSLSELRGRMSTLLEKSTHDDQLISALTAQLSSTSDKSQERTATSKLEQHNKLLEQQLTEEKTKSNLLQKVLQDKEHELRLVEEQLSELQTSIEKENADKSRSASAESIHTPSPTLETLNLAAEAERLRLLELLAVTNKRLEQERQLANQAQDVLRRERHKAARLETKLARQELERVSTRSGYNNMNTSRHKVNESANEELKCKLELLEEELLYLRTRLTNIEQEKQEDLRTYTSMLENSRHAFLDAVKNMSAATNHPI